MIDRPIVLASGSPRRKMLLEAVQIPFMVHPANIDEDHYPKSLSINEIPVYLAREKAGAVAIREPENTLLLAADTIVVHRGDIIGKPGDQHEAVAMLKRLSGDRHQVISGVCLKENDREVTFSSTTAVYFKPLQEADIKYYVKTFRPLDKAGSYAIQEWIGMIGIEKIEGDYFNVVGLPIHQVVAHLRHW